jgi:CRP-like cAMP-binding protein
MTMSICIAAPTKGGELVPNNRLLAMLSSKDLLSVRQHLEAVPLTGGSILSDVGEPLTRLYFVETGVAALLTTLEHCAVGVATVGREGVVDVQALLLGGNTSLARCQVLVPGSALAVEVAAFRNATNRSPSLHAVCEAFTRALLVQLLHAFPCTRLHTLEQRCARWLLMCADRVQNDEFEMATKCLAQMLGLAEQTLSIVTRRLQKEGLICSRSGRIAVLDRRGLETVACECYRIVRDREGRRFASALN